MALEKTENNDGRSRARRGGYLLPVAWRRSVSVLLRHETHRNRGVVPQHVDHHGTASPRTSKNSEKTKLTLGARIVAIAKMANQREMTTFRLNCIDIVRLVPCQSRSEPG